MAVAVKDLESALGGKLDDMRHSPFSPRQGKALSWSSVTYTVAGKGGKVKTILDNVSGSLPCGKVTCLLGPSGAGKSSLLNLLSGRISSGGSKKVVASVTLDGKQSRPSAYKKEVAYVMQEDALFAFMTPREVLRFSANLRLDNTLSVADKEKLVDCIILELSLTKCADTICGNALVPGISGGEKKRTCIGVELITNPTMCFLDEPTSGLDSFSAYNLLKVLRKISAAGTSVLCTIHQPSSEVFEMFDRCMVMKSGRMVYEGAVKDINPYFEKIGEPIPLNYNPADHIIFVVEKLSDAELEKKGAFLVSNASQAAAAAELSSEAGPVAAPFTASICTQLYWLCWRESLKIRRDVGIFIGRFLITGMLNLVQGLIFQDAARGDNALPQDLGAHFGALTFCTIGAMFGTAQATLLEFPDEKPLFLREYSTGTYGTFSYGISKIIAELPLAFMQNLLLVVIVYNLCGFRGNFLVLVCCEWALGLCASSVAMLLGAGAKDVKKATEASPALFVPQLMFSGFFIAINKIPTWLRWAQYLCSLKYTLNIVLVNEFGVSTCGAGDGAEQVACRELLERNDVDESMVWRDALVLMALFLGFRLAALLILRKTANNA
jgi:ABC-type multidrug transport system ATPase subunit